MTADDRASTSPPQTSPYWRTLIDNGAVTVVRNNDLKPDPKDNASVVLTYHNAGLFSKLGRVWVCWGDLRTEYVKEEVLRARLKRHAGQASLAIGRVYDRFEAGEREPDSCNRRRTDDTHDEEPNAA